MGQTFTFRPLNDRRLLGAEADQAHWSRVCLSKTFRVHAAASNHNLVSAPTAVRCACGLCQPQPMTGPQVGEDFSKALTPPAMDFQKASAVGPCRRKGRINLISTSIE